MCPRLRRKFSPATRHRVAAGVTQAMDRKVERWGLWTGSRPDTEESVDAHLALRSYRALRVLGEGGMSKVWLARHVRTGALVAVKTMKEESRGEAARLIREARLARRVVHPNVLRVRELLRAPGGQVALVMDYLVGESLAKNLARGRALPLLVAARLGCGLAAALDATHRAGVVHRDVKPDNVLLAERGSELQATLVDFGVATCAHWSGPGGATDCVGTPSYMAPEQIQGLAVDGRADVFSLGVVLFECLAGLNPFEGVDLVDTFRRTLAPAPSLARFAPSLPAPVIELIDGMLRTDRETRLSNLRHVYDTLLASAHEPAVDVAWLGEASTARWLDVA